jgi:lipid A 3-O-deacylase
MPSPQQAACASLLKKWHSGWVCRARRSSTNLEKNQRKIYGMIILKTKKLIINPLAIFLFFVGISCSQGAESAEDGKEEYIKDRYTLAMVIGNSYDPVDDIDFYMLSGCALFDYDKVWPHMAPEPLRFKVEYNIGIASPSGNTRLMTSANMFALYYLDLFENEDLMPYAEGGIGIIYTDFKVKGQGLRVNFNPQMGLGVEFKSESRDTYFLAFRLHHLSNGRLYHENRGINSALLMLGRFF